jgi:hypothetical protein
MFEFYRRFGADLIPLEKYILGEKLSKKPLLPHWSKAFYDPGTIDRMFEDGHSVGYRPKADELVIDVEAASPGGHSIDGRESFRRLVDDFGIDLTQVPKVSSPSGGCHYYFTKNPLAKTVKKLTQYPGIDFLSLGCQVVAAPSRHWQGGNYTLDAVSEVTGRTPSEAPLFLITALAPSKRIIGDVKGGVIDSEELSAILSYLDVKDYGDNDAWVKLLMSCHHATAGEGYEAFEEWSWGDPRWSGNSDVSIRWESMDPDKPGAVSYRTLFAHARAACIAKGNILGLNLITTIQDTRCRDTPACTDEEGKLVAPVDRIHITTDHEEGKRIEESIQSLSRCPNLYCRAGELVRLSKSEKPPVWQEYTSGTWSFQSVQPKAVRSLLSDYCAFYQNKPIKGDDGVEEFSRERVRCPQWLLDGVTSKSTWPGISPIEAVVQTPCLLKDGSILQEPGFNPAHGLMYKPNQGYLTVADAPTLQDAQAAAQRLYEVVIDFPFITPHHRSVWLAAVLTMLARHSYRGPTPLFFFDGNTSGVGKSLLIDSVGYITLGRRVAKMAYPPNNEEMDKRLTTVIRNATPIQLLDNVDNNKEFGFPSLDAAITGGTWDSRILGKSESTGEMDITTMFCATGNNLKLGTSADAARRLAYCRIVYSGEDPSTRTGFRHEDLPGWIQENRASLVKDALTILKAYHTAGRPKPPIPKWGSFEAWSDAVRAPIAWLGEPDPMGTRKEMAEQADTARDKYLIVIEGWRSLAGDDWMTITEMLERVGQRTSEDCPMLDALDHVLDERRGRLPAIIGKELSRYLNHNVGGLELQSGSGRRRRHYRVITSEPPRSRYSFLR